jgi:catechol 2,3-dioxygenase-like lactoylglutathione lyase family enzyme
MHHEAERLVGLYDQGTLSRRQLLQGLFALGVSPYVASPVAGGLLGAGQTAALFHTRTLNHVTLYASSVARSKAFYQRLTGLPIQAEDKDFCEFRLEGGFLGIYAPDAGQQPGFNHFCFGIDAYEPQATLTALKAAVPEAKPTLENENQVYVQDPDGVRVQFADVRYKR